MRIAQERSDSVSITRREGRSSAAGKFKLTHYYSRVSSQGHLEPRYGRDSNHSMRRPTRSRNRVPLLRSGVEELIRLFLPSVLLAGLVLYLRGCRLPRFERDAVLSIREGTDGPGRGG